VLSTEGILRDAGYDCVGVADADQASAQIEVGRFDAMVTDLVMPGNAGLEFVSGLNAAGRSLPVVLVTGYPTAVSAVESHRLPIVSYLVKPLDIPRFLSEVGRAVSLSCIQQSVRATQERLRQSQADMARIESLIEKSVRHADGDPLNVFLAMTLHDAQAALDELKRLLPLVSARDSRQNQASRQEPASSPSALLNLLRETSVVLQESKREFKSKPLADLRRRIDQLLDVTTRS
jgi:CheY-like chemotaxis protein